MSRLAHNRIRKLERKLEATGVRELRHRIEVAQVRVNRRLANAARDPKAVTSKRFRDGVEAQIAATYAGLSRDFEKWLGDVVREGGPAWHGEVADELRQRTGRRLPLMRFDRERVRRYQELIHDDNREHLAAVFTDKMTEQAIRKLRAATVDTFRQANIEGWTANETQRRMQDAWDRLAGNKEGRRFVDRGGREWTNSRYLQMLTRTTVQRVSREIQIDTLTENGFKFGQVSVDASDPCPICEAWEGVVVQLAGSGIGGGRYPTYQQSIDAGMWHPNCVHRIEYIDEDLEGDEIRRQNEEKAPESWDDPAAVLDYRNRIEISRYQAQGMSETEAKRAVMRDRLKRRATSGMISERFNDAIDAIPDSVLDQMDLNALPHFRYRKKDEDHAFSRNSSRGGWIVLDRDADSSDGGRAAFDKAFYSLQTKRGVDTTGPTLKTETTSEYQKFKKDLEEKYGGELYLKATDKELENLESLEREFFATKKKEEEPKASENKVPEVGLGQIQPSTKETKPTTTGQITDSQRKLIIEDAFDSLKKDDFESGDQYGFRMLPPDLDNVTEGDIISQESFVWVDGQQTQEKLDGVSATDAKWGLDESKDKLERSFQNFQKENYWGRKVALIAGEKSEDGEDPGEVLIRSPKILRVWNIGRP